MDLFLFLSLRDDLLLLAPPFIVPVSEIYCGLSEAKPGAGKPMCEVSSDRPAWGRPPAPPELSTGPHQFLQVVTYQLSLPQSPQWASFPDAQGLDGCEMLSAKMSVSVK